MQRKITGMIVGVVVALGASYPVIADTTAKDAKDYRAAIMTTFRGHIGAASMIARGLVDDNGQMLAHAQGLANSAKELKNVFQEGSDVDGSESLPAIWSEPDKFAAAIDMMVTSSAALEAAVASGDSAAVGAAFRNVGMSCRGCHDDFRKSND